MKSKSKRIASHPIPAGTGRRASQDRIDEGQMFKMLALWLETRGWRCLVISADRIEGPVDTACNYELIFRFTGAPPKRAPDPETHKSPAKRKSGERLSGKGGAE
jgi:hypothetical protein